MPFQSEKQRRYLWANEPEIARDWTDTYGSGIAKALGGRIPFQYGSSTFSPGIEQILTQNNNFGWDQDVYKTGIMDQFKDIQSQYNQPVTYADSPIFQAGFEKWNPSSIGSGMAAGAQKLKSALGLGTSATAAPFGSGMYVPSKENVIQKYIDLGQSPENAKALGESEWANAFGHEASHLGWDYENPLKQLESISPHLKTSASNPSYAGEEQWNYMHDLMYGPRYGEDVLGRPGQDYLTTKGLINKGDLSYTPEAHKVIADSGLISEHKKALGFGVNPHEDTMMGRMRSYPNAPIGEDTSDPSLMQPHDWEYGNQWQTPDERNLLQKGLDYAMNTNLGQKIGTGYNALKENVAMPAFGVMGALANQFNPLNPKSKNYNPELQGQIDQLKASGHLGGYDPSGPYKITSGPLAGKNLVSGFGTNDYDEMLSKKISWFEKRKAEKKSISDKAYKKALEEQKRREEQKKTEGTNIGGGWTRQDTGGGGATFTGPGGQSHQGWSNTPAGFAAAAASEGTFAGGGLAALWPR